MHDLHRNLRFRSQRHTLNILRGSSPRSTLSCHKVEVRLASSLHFRSFFPRLFQIEIVAVEIEYQREPAFIDAVELEVGYIDIPAVEKIHKAEDAHTRTGSKNPRTALEIRIISNVGSDANQPGRYFISELWSDDEIFIDNNTINSKIRSGRSQAERMDVDFVPLDSHFRERGFLYTEADLGNKTRFSPISLERPYVHRINYLSSRLSGNQKHSEHDGRPTRLDSCMHSNEVPFQSRV